MIDSRPAPPDPGATGHASAGLGAAAGPGAAPELYVSGAAVALADFAGFPAALAGSLRLALSDQQSERSRG